MRRVTNGMHLSNAGQWDIEQMLRVARPHGAVTLLHFQMFPRDPISDNGGDSENRYWYGKLRWGWEPQGIPAAPERLIHVRLYQANWADWDPKEVARRTVPLLSAWTDGDRTVDLWADPFLCVSPCNEQNLEGPLDLRHDYVRHATWQLRFWDEVDRLRPDRKAPSCLGAWAFGHDVTPDVPDSEYMVPEVRELCHRVDILATHPYANFSFAGGGLDTADPERAGYYYLLRDFRPKGWRDSRQPGRPHDPGGILAQIPGKPLLISESGTFVHGDTGRTADTLAAMRLLLDTAAKSGRCLGVTWFIWNSGPEHAGNRIWHNVGLRAGLEALPSFETAAQVPTKGQGGHAMENRFWPILGRRAKAASIGVDDLRGTLVTGGRFGPLTPARVESVAVHHTAAPEATTWEAVAGYHVRSRGFAGIGYHVGVRNGRIAYLGDLDTARAHVANENHRYLGLCMAGNYETSQPSEANMKALKVAYEAMCEWLGRTVPPRPHRDLAPPGYTVCSGRHLIARLGELAGEAPTDLSQALLKWADRGQTIQPNEGAALYRQMRSDGFWPLSDESGARGQVPEVEGHAGIVAQLGRDWSGPSERIYFWDGRQVRWVPRR